MTTIVLHHQHEGIFERDVTVNRADNPDGDTLDIFQCSQYGNVAMQVNAIIYNNVTIRVNASSFSPSKTATTKGIYFSIFDGATRVYYLCLDTYTQTQLCKIPYEYLEDVTIHKICIATEDNPLEYFMSCACSDTQLVIRRYSGSTMLWEQRLETPEDMNCEQMEHIGRLDLSRFVSVNVFLCRLGVTKTCINILDSESGNVLGNYIITGYNTRSVAMASLNDDKNSRVLVGLSGVFAPPFIFSLDEGKLIGECGPGIPWESTIFELLPSTNCGDVYMKNRYTDEIVWMHFNGSPTDFDVYTEKQPHLCFFNRYSYTRSGGLEDSSALILHYEPGLKVYSHKNYIEIAENFSDKVDTKPCKAL